MYASETHSPLTTNVILFLISGNLKGLEEGQLHERVEKTNLTFLWLIVVYRLSSHALCSLRVTAMIGNY